MEAARDRGKTVSQAPRDGYQKHYDHHHYHHHYHHHQNVPVNTASGSQQHGQLPRDPPRSRRPSSSAARQPSCEPEAPYKYPDEYGRHGHPSTVEGTRPRRRPSESHPARRQSGFDPNFMHGAESQEQRERRKLMRELEHLAAANERCLRNADAHYSEGKYRAAGQAYEQAETGLARQSELERRTGCSSEMWQYTMGRSHEARARAKRAHDKVIDKMSSDFEDACKRARRHSHRGEVDLAMGCYRDARGVLRAMDQIRPGLRETPQYRGKLERLRWERDQVEAQAAFEKGHPGISERVWNFSLLFCDVEALMDRSDGHGARRTFDEAKRALCGTLVDLPLERLPSKKWKDDMKAMIIDIERRAKQQFGKNW